MSKRTSYHKPPALVRSDNICKELSLIAAFNLHDEPETAEKVYRAIRQLQLLDAAAEKAGILPSRACR
jgi:hypothetical protein